MIGVISSQQTQLAARFPLERVNPAVRSAGESQKSNLAELDTSRAALESLKSQIGLKSQFGGIGAAITAPENRSSDDNAFREAAKAFEREYSVSARLVQQSVEEERSRIEAPEEATTEPSSGDPDKISPPEERLDVILAEKRNAALIENDLRADAAAREKEEAAIDREKRAELFEIDAVLADGAEKLEDPVGETAAQLKEEASDAEVLREAQAAVEAKQQAVDDAAQVRELKVRDTEVRQHIAAHKAAPGPYGEIANYEFTTGPDGRQYATDGDVMIEVSAANSPEETVERMNMIIATALAPADPSAEDRAAAQLAQSIREQALAELRALEMEAALSKYEKPEPQVNATREPEAGESNDAAIKEARRVYEEAAQIAQQAVFNQMRGANDQSSDALLYGLA